MFQNERSFRREPGTDSQVSFDGLGDIPAAFERFLRAVSARISDEFCAPVGKGPFTAVACGLSSALLDIDSEDCVVSLRLAPATASAYLIIDRRFARWAVDVLLGAPPAFAGQWQGALTELDLRAIAVLIELAAGELKTAFANVCGISSARLLPSRGEIISQGGGIEIIMLASDLEVSGFSCPLRLLVPAALARSARPAALAPVDDSLRERLGSALANATVDVQAVLRGADMRFGDLMRLRPGIVMALPRKAGSSIDCQVNGVVKFHGEMVRSGVSPALLIQHLDANSEAQATPSVPAP